MRDTFSPSFARPEFGGGLIVPFRGATPTIGEGSFVAPGAAAIGRVRLGRRASLWFGTIARGDIAPIEIGEDTNIQDLSLLHVGDAFPCIVGARCVVGHRAILHGCRVGDETLIGMGAILLNGSVIGRGCVIAAGALIPEGKVIPPRSVVMGAPGKIVKTATDEQVQSTLHFAEKYANLAGEYLRSIGSPPG